MIPPNIEQAKAKLRSLEAAAVKEAGKPNGAAQKLSRFKLIPFNEIRLPEGRSYLVKGMIPRQGLIVAWGPPKCGKSFWAFDLSMHIALEIEYRGYRVQQGLVVYVAAEGASGQGGRVAAWRSRNLPDGTTAVPFALLPDRMDLIAEADQLITDIRTQLPDAPPALVVIDTLNRTFSGSESSDEDMTGYVRAADKIKDAFGCAVLIVHHCGIESTRPRGHTSLTGAVDAQISVRRDADGKICTKVEWAKDFLDGAETVSRLEVVEVGLDEDGEPITSCVIVPSDDSPVTASKALRLAPAVTIALQALHDAIDAGGTEPPASNHIPANTRAVSAELWRKHAYAKDSDANPQAKKKAFQRAIKTLQAKGHVGCWNEWIWPIGTRS